jgi:glycosyltransferase involved in cell wall biosynthesis
MAVSLGRRGSIPLYGLEMTKALAKICDVSALVASGAYNIEKWRDIACPKMEISTYHSNLTGFLSFFNIRKFMKIKKFMASQKPDIIYYVGTHYWKPVIDLIVPSDVSVVMTVHDPVIHAGEDYLAGRIAAAIEIRKPDAYILLNESQKDGFIRTRGIPEHRVAVIPHGIFSSYRELPSELANFPDFVPLTENAGKYFLFIGRIVEYKGIATLFKTFQTILDKTDRVLVVAGSGNFSEEEKQEISKIPDGRLRIFNRWLEDAEISALTANAYMTILPYEGATQSGVIPLSAAFGTPSIASDSGGLSEQIVDGKTGFIFRAGNISELRNVMIKASDMPDAAYQKMRGESSRYAAENWDWDVLAKKLVDFASGIITPTLRN